jgi:murein DD-endopeptidase MepM/ murein hydrolase activator NlpD
LCRQTLALQQTLIEKKQKQLKTQHKEKSVAVRSLQQQIALFEQQNKQMLEDSQRMAELIQRLKHSVAIGTGRFIKPVAGWLSSQFGNRFHPIFKRMAYHSGIDFAAPSGTPVQAADTATVVFAGVWGGYGKAIILDHGDGVTSVYGHLSRIIVRKGDAIQKRDIIGYVGSTGLSTGPHLHFEIRENGLPIDPITYLNQ